MTGGESLNRLGRLAGLFRSGRGIVLLNVLITSLIAASAGFAIWHTRQSTLEEHQREMNSLGVVLAEQTLRYAQVVDLILLGVQSHIENLGIANTADFAHQFGNSEFQNFLSERVKNVPQVDAIVLIDANGLVTNWSRAAPVEHFDTKQRDYHAYFKTHNDRDLFIGAPSKALSTGKMSLFFARRISGPDGRFLGLVLGILDVRYLNDFYQAAAEHLKESIALLRNDGTVLMRYPNPEAVIGLVLPQGSPWYARVAAGGGNYVYPSALDGTLNLVEVQPLRDYPLVVDVIMTEADVFAKWRQDMVYIASFALIAALAFSVSFWILAQLFRRQSEQNAKLDAVLSNITQGVCFFDGRKRLLLWNRRYAEIYNLPPEATQVGRSLAEIVAYRYDAGTSSDMSQSEYLAWGDELAATGRPSNAGVTLKNGRTVAINYQPMPDGGWVATHEDITERQQAEANVVFLARHDALTRLPNRVLFRERMEQAIAMAGRGSGFAVICLDLDNFKQVNDALGHPVGDGLLIAVADRLRACVRAADTVARLGGDEFAIIQLAVQQPEEAEMLASRIIAAFRPPFEVEEHQVMTGVSIGVTVPPGDDVSYETLMRDADIALYLAKTEGRGAARFFEPKMDARIHLRRVLEQDLQGAVARNEFELYYQPQVNLISNKVSGFEALLRWHHPARGFVSPTEFIPVAEETGMIVAIGEWVLRNACLEAERWPSDISVAVNLSPVQFKKGDLAATVQAALAESGLRPDRLELEITESVFMRDSADTLRALHQLRGMGISVALDDFGTGYSSLSYLRRFPFNKIKIDQSFVRDLMTNKESASIVRAVTGLGQSLDMITVAEGVETLEQLQRLRDEGCTEVQGYFFSRPRPAGDVPSMIEALRQAVHSADPVTV